MPSRAPVAGYWLLENLPVPYRSPKNYMMPMVISAIMFFGAATANASASFNPVPKEAFGPMSQSVEEYVRQYFADTPVLIEVARCESRFRQYDEKGAVLRGEVMHDDIGIMQINDHFHGDASETLGNDILTIEGNLAYAKYLYGKEGTTPWNSSKPCWGKSNVALSIKK